MITWFKDDVFRHLFVNAGWLLVATALATAFGFITTLLIARALGPQSFGVFALVLVYVETVGRLVSFQAWQAIVKYGSDALEEARPDELQKLIKFGFCLDIGSALLGFVIAIMLSQWFILLLDWEQSIQPLIIMYSWLILFSWNGTPTGILRLFDRFDLLSLHNVVNSLVRLIGVLICLVVNPSIAGFVLCFLVTGVFGQLLLFGLSIQVLHAHALNSFLTYSLKGLNASFSGIWDYVWTTNLNATIRMVSRELDLIIIAALTTPASVGIYKIAKQFAKLPTVVIDPLYQSIYPELARLASKQDYKRFVAMMKRTTFFVGGSGILGWVSFLLIGPYLIELTVGEQFVDAYLVSAIYMLALVISLISFSFQPAILALGQPRASFVAQILSTTIYLIVLVALTTRYEVIGASLAYVVYYLVWSVVMFVFLRHAFSDNVSNTAVNSLQKLN